jgi:DNA-binding phage protein
MSKAEKFTHFDPVDYLGDDEDIELYFEACVQDDPGDGTLIRAAMKDIYKNEQTS